MGVVDISSVKNYGVRADRMIDGSEGLQRYFGGKPDHV
jgi:hypothetical protein